MLVGAHVSTRGGLDRAVDQAAAIGAEVIQTHPSSPQQWRSPQIAEDVVEALLAKSAAFGLRQHWFHGAYLVNLASEDPLILERSVTSLTHALDLAGRIGAEGVIFHPGSHRGAGWVARRAALLDAVRRVLAASDSPARLVVENSAGAGGCIGCSFDEVADIVHAVDDPRIAVCLDTCHAFASGYDLRTAETVTATLDAFDTTVGMERLVALHVNDSKGALGSNRDRHANLGAGEIGLEGLRALLADPRLARSSLILEVPGAGEGPDLEQVNVLRALAGLEATSATTL